jgi:hypothetical protein
MKRYGLSAIEPVARGGTIFPPVSFFLCAHRAALAHSLPPDNKESGGIPHFRSNTRLEVQTIICLRQQNYSTGRISLQLFAARFRDAFLIWSTGLILLTEKLPRSI